MLSSGYILDIRGDRLSTPQKRALTRYRKRLGDQGLARFEVLGRDADRKLIRLLAKRMAGDDPESARIRASLRLAVGDDVSTKGGVLEALRRSPLVGADLELQRSRTSSRKVDL